MSLYALRLAGFSTGASVTTYGYYETIFKRLTLGCDEALLRIRRSQEALGQVTSDLLIRQ